MEYKRYSYSRLLHLIPPIFLALVTALTYYFSLHYDLQFDDLANIQKHFNIRHYSFIDLFMSGSRWISYWLNSLLYQIGRFDPFYYRVSTVLIHISNGILIFFILLFVLSRLKENTFFKRNSRLLATITASLFLLHPVQTQTMSYVIQGQLEGMALLAMLSMVYCFLRLTHANNLFLKTALILLLFILSFLACGTKEITIVAPALLLLVDWFFVAQGSCNKSFKRRLFLHATVTFIMIITYLYLLKPKLFIDIVSMQFQAHNNIGNIITEDPKDIIKPLHFFISQFKVILHYIWIFIWPVGISVEYDWKLSRSFFAADSFFPFLVIILLTTLIARLLYRNPTHLIGFGALWFAICIALRSSIIPSPELLADYKTYSASFGLFFIFAAGLIKALEHVQNQIKITRLAHHIFLPLFIFTLSCLTVRRNLVWRSGLEFWGNIIKNAPNKARAYNNYGVELSQNLGKFAESIPYFKQAISMDKLYPDPLNNIAVAYAKIGQIDEAISALRSSLQINRSYPEGYNNLAALFLEKNDQEQAKKALEKAIQLRPYYGKAHFNLGRIYFEQGEQEKGWECFRKCCIEADLDNELGFTVYAKASLAIKKYDDAIFAYKKILELNPQMPDGIFNLANAYFLGNYFDDALKLYLQLTQCNQNDGRVWNNLGETYLKLDNTNNALPCFEKALSLQSNNPQLYVRIAACNEKLGNPAKAKETLKLLIAQNMSESVNTLTKGLIAKLDEQYHLT